MNYDQDRLEEKELDRVEESFAYKDTSPVSWINIDGLHDVALMEKLGHHFGIHPLTQEDILNTGQRPTVEMVISDFMDFSNFYFFQYADLFYSGCQKNVPIAERFFATTLMPPSFFRNIIMTSGINAKSGYKRKPW